MTLLDHTYTETDRQRAPFYINSELGCIVMKDQSSHVKLGGIFSMMMWLSVPINFDCNIIDKPEFH